MPGHQDLKQKQENEVIREPNENMHVDNVNVYVILFVVFILAIVVSKILVRFTGSSFKSERAKKGKTKASDTYSKSLSNNSGLSLTQRNVANTNNSSKANTFTV